MDLHTVQIIFYTLGSILISAILLVIIAAVITFFVVKRKITKMSNQVNQKISQVKNIYDHKEKYMFQLISKGSSNLLENIANMFVKKKK